MITAIAAVSEDWGIGKNNDLLFNIPSELVEEVFLGESLTILFLGAE